MPLHKVGDLVIMTETVEWDERVVLKGEVCIVSRVHDRNDAEDGIFFDYTVCAGDGVIIDVWEGEIVSIAKK